MKNKLLLLVTLSTYTTVFCQMDTIYSNNEKLAVNVKEITEDAVRFSYPNEDLINTSYKNSIQKIVLKNGRVQNFKSTSVFNDVKKPIDDYKVTITNIENDIKGLFRLGNINASIKGGTVFSSVDKMKDIAYKKLQKIASMMGGNVVFVTNEHSATGQMGGYYQAGKLTEASFSGYVYTNILVDIELFQSKVVRNKNYEVFEVYNLATSDRDYNVDIPKKLVFTFTDVYNENGIVYLKGLDRKNKEIIFQLVNFDDEYFYLFYKSKFSTSIQMKFRF